MAEEITTALYHLYYAKKALLRAYHYCGDGKIESVIEEVTSLTQEATEKWLEEKRKRR